MADSRHPQDAIFRRRRGKQCTSGGPRGPAHRAAGLLSARSGAEKSESAAARWEKRATGLDPALARQDSLTPDRSCQCGRAAPAGHRVPVGPGSFTMGLCLA